MMIQYIPAKQYLNDLRAAGQLSDEKIGAKVGLTKMSIWRLRTGKTKTTKHETVVKIANFHAQVFKQKGIRARRSA